MLFLFLSVLCSVLLGFIFKLFGRYGVDSFQAIVFNYFVCFCCGWLHVGHFPVTAENTAQPWMPYALVLGLVFVSGFNGAALTVRYFGVTVSQIMQKMSILITVPFAILAYGESSGWGKIIGFVLAVASIVLVNWPSPPQPPRWGGEGLAPNPSPIGVGSFGSPPPGGRGGLLWIPVLTWVLSGVIEVLFVRVQKEGLAETGDPAFITAVFGTAGVLGLAVALFGWLSKRLVFSWRHVFGGIVLGIPNYGSMLFLLLALGSGLEGSFVFPVTNVGIIIATTIGAVWLFRERLSRVNWLGIGLAVAAIALISF